MAERRRRSSALLRSLRLQGFALLAVLIVIPLLLYSIFAKIETERRDLLLAAVRDTGDAIATGLTPELQALEPARFGELDARLARFADPRRQITLLFHPGQVHPNLADPGAGAAGEQFFLVASAPSISTEQLAEARARLASLGVMDRLGQSCAGGTPLTERVAARDGASSIITSVTGVAGVAGCWAVVIAVNSSDMTEEIAARPAEVSRELRVAGLIYTGMATLILVIFASIRANLRRFRARALASEGAGGFLEVTDVPEMVPVARAIDAMVQRLRETAEMLRQAAEDNAHAFKGPIATMRQAVELLTASASSPAQLRFALSAVQASLDRLDGLVGSVRRLDAATADLLEMSRSRVDLSALLRGLVADCRAMRAAQGATIVESLPAGVVVLGEAEAIECIFENLLENAFSFSPPHGVVRVGMISGPDTVLVTVEDDGPGVPDAALQRIFDRYYSDRRSISRGDRPNPAKPAHFGIGLWIARQNARALGGEIIAENRVPHGLAMHVRLPLAAARPEAAQVAEETPPVLSHSHG